MAETLPEVPQPIVVDEERIIENVFPPDGLNVGDRIDQTMAEEYLESRHQPDPDDQELVVQEPVTLPDGYKRKWYRDGWVADITPVRAVAYTALLFAGVNIAANIVRNAPPAVGDTMEALGDARDQVKDWLGMGPDQPVVHKPRTEIVETLHEQVEVVSASQTLSVGSTAVRANTARRFLAKVEKLEGQGYAVQEVVALGEATDVWLGKPNAGMGQEDKRENGRLSRDRAEGLVKTTEEEANKTGLSLPKIKVMNRENVLTSAQINSLEASGGSTIGNLVTQFEVGDMASNSLRQRLSKAIGKPGVTISALMTKYFTTKHKHTIQSPVREAKPRTDDRDHDYDLDLYPSIPILFFPRLRRRLVQKVKTTMVNIAEKVRSPAIVKLLPEARVSEEPNENGKFELKKHAWRFTRIYQVLMREDRIKQVLTHSYEDDDGDSQSVRVLFMDHEPSQEIVEKVSEHLEELSLLQDGKVPEHLSAVGIFLSKNTGKDPENPQKVGLGIDTQYDSSTFGVAIPTLNLSEIHMPAGATAEDICKYLGALWVLKHENQGHFTDTDKKPAQIRPVNSLELNLFVADNPWLDKMEDLRSAHPPLQHTSRSNLRFKIKRQLIDAHDNTVPVSDVVDYKDTRLNEARTIELTNAAPTRYAGQPGELLAEVAAQVPGANETEMLIPLQEALPGHVAPQTPGKFAPGYRVAKALRHALARHYGDKTRVIDGKIVFPEAYVSKRQATTKVTLGRPEDDPFMAQAMKEARERQWPTNEELLNILVSAPMSQRPAV
jgi:hypothetical protein